MKFFSATQISNSPFPYWVFPDDAQDILEPFHQLSDLYSRHHNLLPKNGDPNISVSVEEIQSEEVVKSDILTFSPNYSHSLMEDIQREYERGLYLQPPSKFEHSHCYKSELSNLGFGVGYHLEEHDNGTLSPKQGEQTFYLHYGLSFGNQPYCKTMKFIETKVAAMKLQGFNH
jgi:hypothetical protein